MAIDPACAEKWRNLSFLLKISPDKYTVFSIINQSNFLMRVSTPDRDRFYLWTNHCSYESTKLHDFKSSFLAGNKNNCFRVLFCFFWLLGFWLVGWFWFHLGSCLVIWCLLLCLCSVWKMWYVIANQLSPYPVIIFFW